MRRILLSTIAVILLLLVSALSLWANGYIIHVYGVGGIDANVSNGKATDPTYCGTTHSVGEGNASCFGGSSGNTTITASPLYGSTVSWSSWNNSWSKTSGCGAGQTTCTINSGNYVDVTFAPPVPTATSFSTTPTTPTAGSSFTLTVTGSFMPSTFPSSSASWSVIYFNGTALTTTFDSTTQVHATVPAQSAGSYTVYVNNPAVHPACTTALDGGGCNAGGIASTTRSVGGGNSSTLTVTVQAISGRKGQTIVGQLEPIRGTLVPVTSVN